MFHDEQSLMCGDVEWRSGFNVRHDVYDTEAGWVIERGVERDQGPVGGKLLCLHPTSFPYPCLATIKRVIKYDAVFWMHVH